MQQNKKSKITNFVAKGIASPSTKEGLIKEEKIHEEN